jgi:iron complex outermembrane receptor protein
MNKRPLYLAITALLVQPAYAENINQLDSISITATKIERESKTVPQSVYVVDEKQIESENATSVNELISKIPGVTAVSKNNGYDSRLIIRGAGLKAPYGVREIMVIRDGVPMTDPDSFTRFDVIDIDDIESVEVYKGPGSIFASNATGGVVFIQSKSVFDDQQDRVKVGYGSFGTAKLNVKKSIQASDTDSFAINLSRRQSENSWRDWNQFDTTQFSVKHGHFFDDDSVLETEIAYTQANLQLPQSLSATEFESYKDSGETTNTSSAWQKSGRYSNTLFINSRYETTMGEFDFKPQVYMTRWDHFHPVTGMINDSQDNSVIGTDLAWSRSHNFFNMPSEQIFGLGLRADIQNDAKKYQYADVTTIPGGRIVQVNSDEKGALANIEDSDSQIYSAYFQESFSPNAKWVIDLGIRADLLNMKIKGTEYSSYNFSTGVYEAGSGDFKYQETYQLFSPKIGASYAITDTLNIFAMAVSANQAPTVSEMQANQTYNKADLKGSTSSNIEFGLKQRGEKLSADINVYYTQLTDEIVSVRGGSYPNLYTYYENAGQSERKGIELSAQYRVSSGFSAGANASATDYRYIDYVSSGNDYSGNRPRFIPDYQYALFANWQKQAYSARLEAIAFGPYYIDDANTERDAGYDGVFNLMLGYSKQAHLVNLSIRNLLDKRYAQEVSASYGGNLYTPGAPRNLMLTYQYKY